MGRFLEHFDTFALFLIPIFLIFQFLKTKSQREKRSVQVDQESPWEYGDEWKTGEEEIDLSDWEEIITIPQGFSRMYDEGIPALKRIPVDLNEMQKKLSENQITSKIIQSTKSTSPADGLFVEKKFAAEARRILSIE